MSDKKITIICADCGFSSEITEEWKVFNVVICPQCFRNINLPWCRKGFESKVREPTIIIKTKDFLKLEKAAEK